MHDIQPSEITATVIAQTAEEVSTAVIDRQAVSTKLGGGHRRGSSKVREKFPQSIIKTRRRTTAIIRTRRDGNGVDRA